MKIPLISLVLLASTTATSPILAQESVVSQDRFMQAIERSRTNRDDHREPLIEQALTQAGCEIVARQTTGQGSVDAGHGEAMVPQSLWGGIVFAQCPGDARVSFQVMRRGVVNAPSPTGPVGITSGQWPMGLRDDARTPTAYGSPGHDFIRRAWIGNEVEAFMLVLYGTDAAQADALSVRLAGLVQAAR